jgi:transcriptional regulator with XRE-family HTH domain
MASAKGGRTEAVGTHLGEQLRLLRAQRGWSLERLAGVCGVSRSMLSQIERGEANPTVIVAAAIARALGVSLDELVTPPGEGSPLNVIRGDDPQYLYRADERCRIRTLSPLTAERELEFYEVSFPPRGELRSAPHFAGTREFLTVLRGEVRVESGEYVARLAAGDSVSYPADVSHAIVNVGAGEAAVHLIDTIP